MIKLFDHLVQCECCSGGGFVGNSDNPEDDLCPYCEGLGMVTPDQAPNKCNYCDEIVQEVAPSPILADVAYMCKGCWDMTKEDYKGTYGEDIGEFKPKEVEHG